MDLFSRVARAPTVTRIADGAVVLGAFVDDGEASAVVADVVDVAAAAPFRRVVTPHGPMSVTLTNCGALGWCADATGYAYRDVDPVSGRAWPPIPASLLALAARAAAAAGHAGFVPDACLINRYERSASMGVHQDKNERDMDWPIVSVSLGNSAVFRWQGVTRAGRGVRVRLDHGDVVVFGGAARLGFHGVDRVDDGAHPLLAPLGPVRINLTFRRAG